MILDRITPVGPVSAGEPVSAQSISFPVRFVKEKDSASRKTAAPIETI